jgi:hypothetical protein
MMAWNVSRQVWVRCAVLAALAIIAGVGFVRVGDRLTHVPEMQREVESHLGRAVLFYEVWDGTGHVVFEYGGTVHFDRLVLDWVSIEWPPTPRWQRSGDWWTIDSSSDPATVGIGSTLSYSEACRPGVCTGNAGGEDIDAPVIFGQVNDPDIVWLAVQANGAWTRYPVSSPGLAIRLPEEASVPDVYRWLDAEGHVIWLVTRGS